MMTRQVSDSSSRIVRATSELPTMSAMSWWNSPESRMIVRRSLAAPRLRFERDVLAQTR